VKFSTRVLNWYHCHGRHDLPWQKGKSKKSESLYRTWISEIMLQQTQVATVIPYFEKFIHRFPTIKKLAKASQDDVLLHWAGLGYYSRARNIHKASQSINEQHKGVFPDQYENVLALPGIGPSTAGAILAQALGQCHAILDGNVKRVLARHQAIEGWPGKKDVEAKLWRWAEEYTPKTDVADYTQAIMDLGATVCTRSSPKCDVCPVAQSCQALKQNRVAELPSKKTRKALPVRTKRLLVIRNKKGEYLMEKRPSSGIWGGLWSLPELAMDEAVDESVARNWHLIVNNFSDLPAFRHTFSHFHLDITPCEVGVKVASGVIADGERYQWHADVTQLALAAPVSAIFQMK
jgi:A/G-specific adenine glycosylase